MQIMTENTNQEDSVPLSIDWISVIEHQLEEFMVATWGEDAVRTPETRLPFTGVGVGHNLVFDLGNFMSILVLDLMIERTIEVVTAQCPFPRQIFAKVGLNDEQHYILMIIAEDRFEKAASVV